MFRPYVQMQGYLDMKDRRAPSGVRVPFTGLVDLYINADASETEQRLVTHIRGEGISRTWKPSYINRTDEKCSCEVFGS